MAAILDPNEFKRAFEKAERYPLAAVEVKKLEDTKNLIKRAKDAKGILEVEKKIAVQLVKTRATLQNWERGLSPPYKQLFASRRVMKSMDEEKRINDRNLADSTQKVGVEANTQKKAGNAQGQLKQSGALLDRATKEVKALEEFRKTYDLAKKQESIPAGELVSLEAKAKSLAPKIDEITKWLKKLEKDYGTIAEAEFAEKMDKFAQAKLKDSQHLVDKLLEKIQKLEIPRIAEELKTGRKELYGDRAGWMELVKKAGEEGMALMRLFPETIRFIEKELVTLSKVKQQFPDVKTMSNAKPSDFVKLIQQANEFRKSQIATNDVASKKLIDVLAKHDAVQKKVAKLLKLDFYIEQSKSDKQVSDAGKSLEKAAAAHKQLREAMTKRQTQYVNLRTPTFKFLHERELDYENMVAAAKLKAAETKR